jgi:ABC-type bacteriocin/lantibiotic exporter with double-glycine peptidase domain
MARRSNSPLDVPHCPQIDDGYCLAACVQMVLTYLGLPAAQERLARELDTRPPLGAPASNVTRLRSNVLDATIAADDLDGLRTHLAHGVSPIVFVQTGELPHWQGRVSQHALVVVGMDEHDVLVLDPAANADPISVPIADFVLAWGEMDYLFALFTRRLPNE